MNGDLTLKDVAKSIGWLDAFDADIDFDEADWSTVETDRMVSVEGYTRDRKHVVSVTFMIAEATVSPAEPDWDAYLSEIEEEDDEGEDAS